jgi:hypothetical protein
MTQRVKVAGPGFDFATLSAAIAALPIVPFTEPIVLEVHSTAPSELITIPPTVLPTAVNPLIILSWKSPAIVSPFPDYEYVTGSLASYPAPQPRLVMAQMGFIDIQANSVRLDGIQVNGDIAVTANQDVLVNGCLVVGGQIRVARVAQTPVDVTIANCEVRKCSSQASIRLSKVDGVKVYHNTALIREIDQSLPAASYALQMESSSGLVKNNIFAADGTVGYAVRYGGNPASSTFSGNLYYAFGAASIFRYDNGGPVTITNDKNTWALFMTSEAGGLVEDPEFKYRTDPVNVDLDVSDTCPQMAYAAAIPTVTTDIRSELRPADFVTIGAHENSEVITDAGKVRFLELLAGLSAYPVTKAVLGNSGQPETSLFSEFPAQLAGDDDIDQLFDPVDIEGIVVPGLPGSEGVCLFRPAFQVTLPIYGQLLDSHFDRADELGLLSADDVVFMVKRMHSIPFDACGFMSTQVQIPVEIVA